jgi:hypothetical protein
VCLFLLFMSPQRQSLPVAACQPARLLVREGIPQPAAWARRTSMTPGASTAIVTGPSLPFIPADFTGTSEVVQPEGQSGSPQEFPSFLFK